MSTATAQRWITTKQLANETGFSVATLARWARTGYRLTDSVFTANRWRHPYPQAVQQAIAPEGCSAERASAPASPPEAPPVSEPQPAPPRPADTARAALAAARASSPAEAWREQLLEHLQRDPSKAYYLPTLRRWVDKIATAPVEFHAVPGQLERWAQDGVIRASGAGPYRAYQGAAR